MLTLTGSDSTVPSLNLSLQATPCALQASTHPCRQSDLCQAAGHLAWRVRLCITACSLHAPLKEDYTILQ
jgi:hypothetical protein